jgi:hypothetical protein
MYNPTDDGVCNPDVDYMQAFSFKGVPFPYLNCSFRWEKAEGVLTESRSPPSHSNPTTYSPPRGSSLSFTMSPTADRTENASSAIINPWSSAREPGLKRELKGPIEREAKPGC